MGYMGYIIEKWGSGGQKAFVTFMNAGTDHVYGFRMRDTGWSSRTSFFASGLPLINVPDNEILANLHGKLAKLTISFSNLLSEIEFSVFASENDRNEALYQVRRVNQFFGEIPYHQDGTVWRRDLGVTVSAPLRRVRPTETRYHSLKYLPYNARLAEL